MAEIIEQARAAFRARNWLDARALLLATDAAGGLDPEDLERLALVSDFAGDRAEGDRAFERAHHEWLRRGEYARAARAAFWLGMHLAQQGEGARAGGWFARAGRLLEEHDLDTVEHGYLHLPGAIRSLNTGDIPQAGTAFEHAARIAERFDEPDLRALARMGLGQCGIARGDVTGGMALLDEVMVAVMAGETSPIPSGIVYCAVIVSCQAVFDLRRAQEWTDALDRWSRPQQGLVPFRGQCLVHRSELLQLHGDWPEAVSEARRAEALLSAPRPHAALGMALCQLGELHRLRGDLPAAEAAYRAASRHGREPQPGFALLRLAQGRADAAYGALRRALEQARHDADRWKLLAAYAEVALAAGQLPAAEEAAGELAQVAVRLDTPLLRAVAAHAQGAVRLGAGDATAACEPLRSAVRLWQELEAPYELARSRALLAKACAALGDPDTAELELEAAADTFRRLGAEPDLRRLDRPARTAPGGLTERESEVLTLAAAGKTNREIAAELVLSEHTVRRHLQNVFGKLGVSSRAAATAYAYEHDLIPRVVRMDHPRPTGFGTRER